MEINKDRLRKWLQIESLPLKKILTVKQYQVLTLLHGLKKTKRLPLSDVAIKLDLTEEKVMMIHTQALLRILGYENRENI